MEHRTASDVMKHGEFAIGETFCCDGRRWRCTDVGTRVIVAIRIDQIGVTTMVTTLDGSEQRRMMLNQADAEAAGWFKGPPYAVAEMVFDEYDLEGCSKENSDDAL